MLVSLSSLSLSAAPLLNFNVRRTEGRMLDLDHPLMQHIFAACRAEGSILQDAKRMTLSARRALESS